jgi:RNA polymerase sigma-B factor
MQSSGVTAPRPPVEPAARRAAVDARLLERHARGDIGARQELIERFMPLARRLAGRYRHSGEQLEDLEQVAFLALIKAIDRYDPELGPFVRYAVPNVLGELKRHFRDKGWGMRVPRSVQERVLKVNEALERLSSTLGRSPTPTDIAGATGLEVAEVLEALEAATAYSPAAMDAPQVSDEEGDRTLHEVVGRPEPGYAVVELGEAMGPEFQRLPEREQKIVSLRFLEDLTQAEIAQRVGLSQMHVSRLLRRSLARLENAVDDAPTAASG